VKWPVSLPIGVPFVGSASYAGTVAWATAMERSTGMKIRVTPIPSWTEMMRGLKQGKVDAVALPMSEVSFTIMGLMPEHITREGGPFPLSVAWQLTANPFSLFVRGDSDIKTVYDIKPTVRGKRRLSVPAGIPVNRLTLVALLAFLNLEEKDAVFVNFGSDDAKIRGIMDGKADIGYANPESSVIFEADSSQYGTRWLDLPVDKDVEGRERFLNIRPQVLFSKLYTGVNSSHGVTGTISPIFFAFRDDTDPEFIYNLVKWTDENYESYKKSHKIVENYMGIKSVRASMDYIYLPIHKGAMRYFKEKGLWSEKDDIRRNYNMDLLMRYDQRYKDAIAEADKKGIKVDPKNNEWVDFWRTFKKDLPIFRVMYDIPK
jgi:TRAP transporter TAXI family solute receptor